MEKDLNEEVLEIIKNIKNYLKYQKTLGAFVYGSDINEEMLADRDRMNKLERRLCPGRDERSRHPKFVFSEMSLFEKKEKGKIVPISSSDKRRLLDDLCCEIGHDCVRCNLGRLGRNKVVFGEGNV
ncbi:MAG: hypothetical protein N2746_03675, partial [Deltaproteobacteria bacterium]|nr:hypothetical protein [Deltaproteobacteria bacterium]